MSEPGSTKAEVIGVKELADGEAKLRLDFPQQRGVQNREEGRGELLGAGANYCWWEEEEEDDGDVCGGDVCDGDACGVQDGAEAQGNAADVSLDLGPWLPTCKLGT